MGSGIFAPRRAGDGPGLGYSEAGAGKAIVAILGEGGRPTPAHALLAEGRRVIVFAADAGTPQQAAQRIGAAVAALRMRRFDLLGECAGATPAAWLALVSEAEVGAVVLAQPQGQPDEAFAAITRPVLVLAGTKAQPAAVDRWRLLLSGGHFMFVWDAGRAIGAERPQALAFIAREFFERGDLFLVSRESGVIFP